MAGELVLKGSGAPSGGKQQVIYSQLTQEQLIAIKGTTDNIQDIIDARVYENTTQLLDSNITVYADGSKGNSDPLGLAAGWHYANSDNLTDKINWYFIGNLNPDNLMTLETLTTAYAVINLRSAQELPYFTLYTKPYGDVDDAASWYRSRINYTTNANHASLIGQQALIYFGENDPNVFPTLARIPLSKDASTSVGPQLDQEEILFGALSTSSGYAKNTYNFLVNTMGYINNRYRTDFLLTTSSISSAASGAATPEYANTHYITLDATNDYLDLDGSGSTLDYTGNWGIGIELEDVSTIQDNSFIVLARSGNNTITLRKGGTNWGIYCFNGPDSVCQANTWYAPQAGSKIFIQCNGTKIEYYLDGTRRANMTMNSTHRDNTSHVVDELQIGKGGTSSYQGALNYWYGGVNNLAVFTEFLGQEAVAEYFGAQDVSGMSFYDDQVLDFITLGEQAYPTVAGLKSVITGDLTNGTESDFVER